MKITMFNGTTTMLTLKVLGGGFDPSTGKMTLIASGDDGKAGTVVLDVTESRDLNKLLSVNTPQVEKVDLAAEDTPPAVVRSIAKEK